MSRDFTGRTTKLKATRVKNIVEPCKNRAAQTSQAQSKPRLVAHHTTNQGYDFRRPALPTRATLTTSSSRTYHHLDMSEE